MITPTKDRIFVRYLDDPEHLHSRVIALVRQDQSLVNQVGVDPLGEQGDYRREMRRAKVVAAGPLVDPAVHANTVVYCAAWDDLDGREPGHALIREADVALLEVG